MISRFCALLIAGSMFALTGCPQGGNVETSKRSTPNPPPQPATDVCPGAQIPRDRLQAIVDRVKAMDDTVNINDQRQLRAGYLAAELSAAGVSEAVIFGSLKNGKFTALVTWLGYVPEVVDLNKFANCEEN